MHTVYIIISQCVQLYYVRMLGHLLKFGFDYLYTYVPLFDKYLGKY